MATAFSGKIRTTIISSEGSDIAVMIASPKIPRYPEGAGIVVVASPIFTPTSGFIIDPDLSSLGLIQVSYLWPGETDPRSGAVSTGAFDYGGAHSVNILRDVIRFAANRMPDKSGRYIVSMTSVPPLVPGLFATLRTSATRPAAPRGLLPGFRLPPPRGCRSPFP